MVRLKDLEEAEKALDEAMNELRRYSQNPDSWNAHERLDERDRKVLVLHKTHFDRLEAMHANVTRAQNRLRAAQAAFAGGGA